MRSQCHAFFILLLCRAISPAFADITGDWDLKIKSKLGVSVYGAPINAKLPALPISDRIHFKADPHYPGTGSFTSTLFSGGWKQNKTQFKGIPTTTIVDTTMSEYLAQGALDGFTFDKGRRVKVNNQMLGKEQNDGTLKGSFTHLSTWKINIASPKKMVIPIQVKLVVTFKGTRSATTD